MSEMYEHKVVLVDSLIPYANNARTHSPEQVSQVAASIREFGFTNPLLIDEENTVIAGHGRLLAAQKLGLNEVPAIIVTDLTEAKKKALIIADNKLALNAGWDEDMLKIEMELLQELDFDLDVLGFDANEINMLFDGWDSDIDLPEKDGENLDGIAATLKIEVSQDEKQFANEVITNALDSAGIEYELK